MLAIDTGVAPRIPSNTKTQSYDRYNAPFLRCCCSILRNLLHSHPRNKQVMPRTLFTDAERAAMREELSYSKPTHGFNDSIDYTNSTRYGTNANGTKYEVK